MLNAPVLAPWLSYRKSRPSGKLSEKVAARVEILVQRVPEVRLSSSWKNVGGLTDKDFAALLGGAQSALKVFVPDIPDAILLEDWREFGRRLSELTGQYHSNGVPDDGIGELLTLEYSRNRLRSTASIGSWLGDLGAGGGWYGWLEVFTTPQPAVVTVDKDEWGDSPAKRAVPAGAHHVVGRAKTLRGEQDVKVPAAGSKRVDLTLS